MKKIIIKIKTVQYLYFILKDLQQNNQFVIIIKSIFTIGIMEEKRRSIFSINFLSSKVSSSLNLVHAIILKFSEMSTLF